MIKPLFDLFKFNPHRLEMAMAYRGADATETARRLMISEDRLCGIIDGEVKPTGDEVVKMHLALGFPCKFFCEDFKNPPKIKWLCVRSLVT